MTERREGDPLNAVLLDARRELQDLRASLKRPGTDYAQVLRQLSDATAKFRTEADTIVNERYTESSLLPIQSPIKQKTLIEQIRTVSPKEYRPFKTNKATELRKKFVRPARDPQPVVPPLRPSDLGLSIRELIQRGVISEHESVNGLLPGIDSRTDMTKAPLMPGLRIDIGGAARAREYLKAAKREEAERANETILRTFQSSESSVRVSTPVQKHPEEEEKKETESGRRSPGPRVYEDLQDEFAYQTLLVVKGKIARETPDFESFQRTNASIWDKINSVLDKIEAFCELFGIQFAEIDGRKLGEAAQLSIVTYDDVYSCLVNVEEFVNKKLNEKAKLIQRNVRIFLNKVLIGRRKLENRAAYKIQSWWRLCVRNQGMPSRNLARNDDFRNRAAWLAVQFANSEESKMVEIEKSEIVVINVLASPQDLSRAFSLMFRNVTVIMILTELPPPYIWEDMVEFFAHCGIPDVNQRIHFVQLRPMNSGDGVSHRLQCDLKSVARIRRILKGRTAFIEPHADWFSEHRLSVDLKLPIFGLVDTTPFQSRGSIKQIFNEARVVTPLSTREVKSVKELCEAIHTLILENKDIQRYLIRYGFSQTEASVAYFQVTPEFFKASCDVLGELQRCLCVSSSTSVTEFLRMIESLGGIVETMPTVVHSFPSVALMLSGDKKMKVIGTFDRLNHAPHRFAGAVVPSVSVDQIELMSYAKMVGGILMKRNVMGYVIVDFIAYKDGDKTYILGYDIRTNAYPSLLYSVYLTLCAGFNAENGKMVLLRNIGEPSVNPARAAVVQNSVTHPGMSLMPIKEVRRKCFEEGIFFDLLNRTGFKIQYFDATSKGKNFALMSAMSAESALKLMEKAYSFMNRLFGHKTGGDGNSTLSTALQAIRRYRERVFPDPC